MYEIFPKSLKEFIEDTSIKLPRFQRKATWDEKKRFELALSVFKNYPLGASILSKEMDESKNITEWLLDGRQRRDSIKMIYENPENLYVWAKKYLPIKNNESIDDLQRKFWTKVSDFIQEDKDEKPSVVECESGFSFDGSVPSEDENESESKISEKDVVNDQEELATLLDILKIAFTYKNKYQTGLTSSFDFKDYFTGKSYISALCGDDRRVRSDKIRKFLQEYKANNKDTYKEYKTFINYLDERFDWTKETSKAKLEESLKTEWQNRQLKIIEDYDRIDFIFMNRKVAIIETHDITSTDSQKIFNLINTGGTQLTASEILSAKPKWNAPIKPPSEKYEKAITKLYSSLDLGNCSPKDKVKWDIPAACTYYFDDDFGSGFSLFFKFKSGDSNEVAKRITIGFKLLSGLLGDGVKKEDIDNLSGKMEWDNLEETMNDIKRFFDSFKSNIYLGVLRSWGKSLSDIVSDTPTLNYLALLFRSWKRLGKPFGYTTQNKKVYDKNTFIELDKIIFGYLNNQWKGSSDSTIQTNIQNFEKGIGYDSEGLFKSVPSHDWHTLLQGIFENNSLNNKPIQKGVLAPLVYYYNCIKQLKGYGEEQPGQIDHIIPQASWKSSSLPNKDTVQNNAFNLALLPSNLNKAKSDSRLNELGHDSTIEHGVSDFEEVKIDDFPKYSDVGNYLDLKKLREGLYYEAFGEKRNKILYNA